MPPKRRLRPSDRPQTPETWGILIVQLRLWMTPADAPASRPYLLLVLDLDHDLLMVTDISAQPPAPKAVEAALAKAMNKPPRSAGKPRRPATLRFADPVLAQALASALERIGVASAVGPLVELEAAARLLEEQVRGQPEHPGLLSMPGVTPEFVGALFAAAAAYYRAAPWVQLNNGQTFALQIPAENAPARIVSILGNGGVEYGLGVYTSWAAFEKLYLGGDDPRALLDGQLAVWFGGPELLPFDDFDALQRHGWDVAGSQAYAAPVVVEGAAGIRRPDLAELRWLEAALRAIPLLVRDHLRPDGQGEYQPFETTLTVSTYGGEVPVHATYPGGQLPLEQRPVVMDDLERYGPDDEPSDNGPVFDRRGMEGMMARLGADLGAPDPFSDPNLRQAQALMYQAWEETNPARRLGLAHQALVTSPDCADAYVLLAEEEADTLARAAEYYRQGVAAGERALGPTYFQENRGHFWGLLETRPYMRAREGLALTLWSLNRRAEAVSHYQVLLELNPSDNQGARYSLLQLFLELDRMADAVALLKQFDDGTAEWLYTGALLEFRQYGASIAADRRLTAALQFNKFVPRYLTGQKPIPVDLPDAYGIGDVDEATLYANHFLNHWRRTPGAVEWLASRIKR